MRVRELDKRSKESWKSIIDDLQQRSDKLENIIGSLRCNSFPEAIQRLQQLRADRFRSPQRKGFAITGSDSGFSSGSNSAYRDDDCSHNLSPTPPSTNLSQARSISLSEQPFNTPGNDCNVRSSDFDYNSLPPQFLTRRAVSAYLHFGSTMFYVMQREACEKLMRTIYEQPADMTKSDACGLCAVATVGSLYCTDVARCEIRTKRTALLRISVPSYPDGPSELTDILGSGFSYCPVSQVTCQGVDNCGGLVNP